MFVFLNIFQFLRSLDTATLFFVFYKEYPAFTEFSFLY